MSTPKLAFYILGCKLISFEASNMTINFEVEGYERVEFQEHPDVGVISICSVTENVVKSFG
ncbi:hypothetical protein [Psychroflexus gondwanensis]|uniref:hypothetical protein n=1 Tax=Psychroflexus gondwanensis TaxID=251 RepID=UPI0009DA9DB2